MDAGAGPRRGHLLGVFDARVGPAPSGLDAELYCVGEQGCDDFPPDLPGRTSHLALELTRDGRSVLFDVQGRPWATYYGEDSILVQDGFDQSTRFRPLYADGTELTLRVVSDPAPAVPGPDVVLVQALDRARDFQVGPEGPGIEPYLVDESAGTLQPLDVPAEIKEWGPNADEFLWGSNDCRAIWQQPDGSWDVHDVDCPDPGWTTVPVDYLSYFDEWVEPGRMLLLDRNSDGKPLAVHASLDRGATWERVESISASMTAPCAERARHRRCPEATRMTVTRPRRKPPIPQDTRPPRLPRSRGQRGHISR